MGMFDQIKDVMKMRSEAKRIQAEIAKITAEYSNGGITVVARGDGSLVSLKVAPEAYDEVKAGKPERFETMMTNVINGAVKKAKDIVQSEMMKMMQQSGGGAGLGGLFGK